MRKERTIPAHQKKHHRPAPTEVMFIASLVFGGFRDLAVSLTADVLKHFIYLDRLPQWLQVLLPSSSCCAERSLPISGGPPGAS